MKFLCLLLTIIIAAVTAIDIRFSNDADCKGIMVSCSNYPPDSCCYVPNEGSFKHVVFGAVPGDWRITMQGFVQYDCQGFRTGGDSHDTSGLQDYCYAGPGLPQEWRSGRYRFHSVAREASTTAATNCSLVDTLILEDGTKYALHGLHEGAISQALEAAVNGTVEATIGKFNLSQL